MWISFDRSRRFSYPFCLKSQRFPLGHWPERTSHAQANQPDASSPPALSSCGKCCLSRREAVNVAQTLFSVIFGRKKGGTLSVATVECVK